MLDWNNPQLPTSLPDSTMLNTGTSWGDYINRTEPPTQPRWFDRSNLENPFPQLTVDNSTTFFNPKTNQYEAMTSQGGVGNPFAKAPTGNYADPNWSPEDQYRYSLLMTQGRNMDAKAFGDRAHSRAAGMNVAEPPMSFSVESPNWFNIPINQDLNSEANRNNPYALNALRAIAGGQVSSPYMDAQGARQQLMSWQAEAQGAKLEPPNPTNGYGARWHFPNGDVVDYASGKKVGNDFEMQRIMEALSRSRAGVGGGGRIPTGGGRTTTGGAVPPPVSNPALTTPSLPPQFPVRFGTMPSRDPMGNPTNVAVTVQNDGRVRPYYTQRSPDSYPSSGGYMPPVNTPLPPNLPVSLPEPASTGNRITMNNAVDLASELLKKLRME
jgi:hypothetical protein